MIDSTIRNMVNNLREQCKHAGLSCLVLIEADNGAALQTTYAPHGTASTVRTIDGIIKNMVENRERFILVDEKDHTNE